MKPDIHRLIELQKLLQAFSQIERRVDRQHGNKIVPENDSEHSYNLAMTAWYLSQWFPELDKNLLLRYALAHDIVEVHAGDTFTYGAKEELASKQTREAEALSKLEKDWTDFEDMTKIVHAYEQRSDAESKFIYALDKIMPIMQIYIIDGYSWHRDNVTTKMLYEDKLKKVRLSPEILPYFEELHQLLLSRPDLIRPR